VHTIVKVSQNNSPRPSIYFLLLLAFLLIHGPSARADIQHFRLTPDASQIRTTVDDPFGKAVNGTFRLASGDARGDVERLAETASVSLTMDTSSYNSNIGLRDQDVRNTIWRLSSTQRFGSRAREL